MCNCIIFKALTLQQLGNQGDFNAFDISLGLPINSLNFSKNVIFLLRIIFFT